MRIRFITDDGERIDKNGGALLPDQSIGEREVLDGLCELPRKLHRQDLQITTAVIGKGAGEIMLFRVQRDAVIERVGVDGS